MAFFLILKIDKEKMTLGTVALQMSLTCVPLQPIFLGLKYQNKRLGVGVGLGSGKASSN